MIFKKPLFGLKVDLEGFNPNPVPSPFINNEKVPDNLDALPDKLWPFMWFFLRQFRWALYGFIIFYTFTSALTALIPLFVSNIVAVFEQDFPKDQLWDALEPTIIAFVLWVIILDSIIFHTLRVFWSHITAAMRTLIVKQLHIYTIRHSLNYFQNDFAGRLSQKINDIAQNIRDVTRAMLWAILFGAVQFIVAIVMSAYVDPGYLWIVLVFVGTWVLTLFTMIPHIIYASSQQQDSKTRVTGQLVDVMSNISSVKLFSRQGFEDGRLSRYLNDFSAKGRYVSFRFSRMFIVFDVITKSLWVSFFGLLLYNIFEGHSTVSDAVLLVPLILSISHCIWWMSDTMIVIFEQLGAIKNDINTLVKPFELTDQEDAKDLNVQNAEIKLDAVTFHYPGQPVFENLNLSIPAGQKIGLVGPSGAGKTTLVQLLLRLHDIQGGSITINGQNIADVAQNSLRNHIAVIPQHTDLLHRSIRDNIAYGQIGASDEQVMEAAKRAHAHEFILRLVDHEGVRGYDAMVGERGVKLSGGQRQRIAIARAILKDAPILLLDEATSALDSESERLIQESLNELMVGRTVIAIAHRLSTISKLDRLLVMRGGDIVEDGSHHDLLKNKGLYARLWQLQSGGFIGEV